LNKDTISLSDSLVISVSVKNTGEEDGKESVLLFISDHIASITPPVKRLKRFTKMAFAVGESKTITFILTPKDLSFIGIDRKPVIEEGSFSVTVGGQKKDFYLKTNPKEKLQ
jgi:beta-glucosidase